MKMNTREFVEQASHDISTYKNPAIDECKNILNEILCAAKLGDIKHDKIESLDVYEDEVHIETSWSARGCENSSSYEFPTSILDAEDYIKAATIWGLNRLIAVVTTGRDSALQQAETFEKQRAELANELNNIEV